VKNGGAIPREPSSQGLRRALRGEFHSPAWHQGYFEARNVVFTVADSPSAVRRRSPAAQERCASGRLEPPPGSVFEGRQAVLEYIEGAWTFLELAGEMPVV